MNEVRFEWDEAKNKSNHKKHGLWFEEVVAAFSDPFGSLFFDPESSQTEDRFVLIGADYAGRILVIVHLHKATEYLVRIISARKATANESRMYEEGI